MTRENPPGGKSAAPALWLALMVVALALLALLWNLLH